MSKLGDDLRELAEFVDENDDLGGLAFVTYGELGHFIVAPEVTLRTDVEAVRGLAYGLYRSTISEDGNPMPVEMN